MAPINQQESDLSQRVTFIGMLLDIMLGVLKITVGIVGHSAALFADGVHSLSDAVTDVFVIFILRLSRTEPDANHPYGHARFETLGTMILGITLVIVAIALAHSNLQQLEQTGEHRIPAWPTLLVALASIAGKEWIYQYTRRVGERLRSNLLIANAWHSRTDAFSSVIVLIGIGGTMLGVSWLDTLAAIVVAIIIAKIGVDLVRDSLKELVDTGLSAEKTRAIKDTIMAVEGVKNVHALRSRHMGSDVFLDLHIIVTPTISVSEGHQIGEWVSCELLEKFAFIKDVTYHIDPEDDDDNELESAEQLLPLRAEITAELKHCWKEIIAERQLEHIALHYLDNKIAVEVYIDTQGLLSNREGSNGEGLNGQNLNGQELAVLRERIQQSCAHLEWLEEVKVWFNG